MVTGRLSSWSVAFHKERPRASHKEPREPENPLTWSSRLTLSSSLNRPPSHVSAVRAPDGMSTTVIDYLLPVRHQTARAMPGTRHKMPAGAAPPRPPHSTQGHLTCE